MYIKIVVDTVKLQKAPKKNLGAYIININYKKNLLYCNRLSQISGLVYVTAAHYRNVVA